MSFWTPLLRGLTVLGCALALSACGGGDEGDETGEHQQHERPRFAGRREAAGTRPVRRMTIERFNRGQAMVFSVCFHNVDFSRVVRMTKLVARIGAASSAYL